MRLDESEIAFSRVGEVGSGDYAVTYRGEAIPGLVRRGGFRGREGGTVTTFGYDFGSGVEDWGYTRRTAALVLIRRALKIDPDA